MAKRVLVIDDDQDFCVMIRDLLKRAGYDVEISPYPITAVAEAFSDGYDLITLDLKMPDFEGTEVARLFQCERVTTPVLVISGYLNDAMIEALRAAGIRHFLPKPFVISELLDIVKDILPE